jgi:hypothetical protein
VDPSQDHLQTTLRILETVREPLLVLDATLRVRFANTPFYDQFELAPAETLGQPFFELRNQQWDLSPLRESLSRVLCHDEILTNVLLEHESEQAGPRSLLLNARRLGPASSAPEDSLILVALEDVTERQHGEARLARQALEATLLHKATALAAETSNFEEALASCVEIVCELTGWPVGHVCLPDADDPDRLVTTNIWHIRDSSHAGRGDAILALRQATERIGFARGEGLPGQIWESGEPAWVINLQDESAHARADLARRAGVRGAFGFPIKIKGDTVAVLEFFSERPMAPDRSLLAMVRSLGEQVGRVIERTRA